MGAGGEYAGKCDKVGFWVEEDGNVLRNLLLLLFRLSLEGNSLRNASLGVSWLAIEGFAARLLHDVRELDLGAEDLYETDAPLELGGLWAVHALLEAASDGVLYPEPASEAVRKVSETINDQANVLRDTAAGVRYNTQDFIENNPWQSVAIAAGIVIGLATTRHKTPAGGDVSPAATAAPTRLRTIL